MIYLDFVVDNAVSVWYNMKLETEMLADFGLKAVDYKRAYYYKLETINGKFSWRR